MITVGLAGYKGGQMAELGDHGSRPLRGAVVSVHRIQEAQTSVYHALWELTQDALTATSRDPERRRPDDASGVARTTVPRLRETQTREPGGSPSIHVLWINAGLSCDGDSVALTAATQPSIEEIALGALPGLPEDRRALAADRLRVRPERRRRRLPRVVLQGRPRRARAVRAGRRGLDPERGDQAARATGAASATTRRPASR